MPLFFVPNAGQFPGAVRYALRAPQLTACFYESAIVLDSPSGRVTVSFAGGNASPGIEPLERLPGTVNFLLGDKPENWHTDVPAYGALAYRDLYPGIDLVYGLAGGD